MDAIITISQNRHNSSQPYSPYTSRMHIITTITMYACKGRHHVFYQICDTWAIEKCFVPFMIFIFVLLHVSPYDHNIL